MGKSPECRRDRLRHALEALPPNERDLLLRFHRGASDNERRRSREALCKETGLSPHALRLQINRIRHTVELHAALLANMPITPAEEYISVSTGPVFSTQPTHLQAPVLENLRHHLQIHFPMLYAQVLEPTFADLREEYSAALAEGHRSKALRVLLQGCAALVGGAACQLAYSLLGRLAALWRARGLK